MRTRRRALPRWRNWLPLNARQCVLKFRESFVSPYADASIYSCQMKLWPAAADHTLGVLGGKLAVDRQLEVGLNGSILGSGADVRGCSTRHFERNGSIHGGEI